MTATAAHRDTKSVKLLIIVCWTFSVASVGLIKRDAQKWQSNRKEQIQKMRCPPFKAKKGKIHLETIQLDALIMSRTKQSRQLFLIDCAVFIVCAPVAQ